LQKFHIMTRVDIDERTIEGKKIIEQLRDKPFAKIVSKTSIKSDAYNRLSQSVKEMKDGKTKPIEQLFK